MSTGQIIEQLREAIRAAEAKGTTRYVIAKTAEIPQSSMSRLMGGKGKRDSLRIETAERLADALGFVLEMKPKKGRKS